MQVHFCFLKPLNSYKLSSHHVDSFWVLLYHKYNNQQIAEGGYRV